MWAKNEIKQTDHEQNNDPPTRNRCWFWNETKIVCWECVRVWWRKYIDRRKNNRLVVRRINNSILSDNDIQPSAPLSIANSWCAQGRVDVFAPVLRWTTRRRGTACSGTIVVADTDERSRGRWRENMDEHRKKRQPRSGNTYPPPPAHTGKFTWSIDNMKMGAPGLFRTEWRGARGVNVK